MTSHLEFKHCSALYSGNFVTLYTFTNDFSGHIGLTISRWDRIRHANLGPLWGALENLVYLGMCMYMCIRNVYLTELSLRKTQFILNFY